LLTASTTTSTTDCVATGDGFCSFVFDVTGNRSLARAADWLIARPLSILLIIVLALVLRFVVHRALDRIVRRVADGEPGRLPGRRAREVVGAASPIANERRRQRTEALGSVLRSIASFVILVVGALMVLAELGLNLAPALASAGIAGVALGFGAQNLVKDFLAGMFVIFEDQYGVGDTIDMGQATGVVQAVGLRVTQLRDLDGVTWYVRNGEVVRIGNRSQATARAVLDVGVRPGVDTAAVRSRLATVAAAVAADPEWSDRLAGAPQLADVDELDGYAMTQVVVPTRPMQQLRVSAELQSRLGSALDAELGADRYRIWVRTEGTAAATP
jgi:small conductance mechanosensitive channel